MSKVTFISVDTKCSECNSPYASKKMVGKDEIWICESCQQRKEEMSDGAKILTLPLKPKEGPCVLCDKDTDRYNGSQFQNGDWICDPCFNFAEKVEKRMKATIKSQEETENA
jgi:formylmethanofuran dehydrogenase subunit E